MLPSFVRAIPNGQEHGDFLALDLGGTNFRVLHIRLQGMNAEMDGKIYAIPHAVMTGECDQLFDHIAACLADFMQRSGLSNTKKLPLGFTFSFPCSQDSLSEARLIRWTKGFNVSGVVGKDVAQLLREAINRRNARPVGVVVTKNLRALCNRVTIHSGDVEEEPSCPMRPQIDIEVDVTAVLNDTVGTLLSCAFKESSCMVGAILGTGSNTCYLEDLAKCPKLKKYNFDEDAYPKQMIINMEWGAYGDDGMLDFIYTKYDAHIDENSFNRRQQLFEKMISAMYLGELVRLVLIDLASEKLVFGGICSAILEQNTFPSKLVSEIENQEDENAQQEKTMEILHELGINNATDADCTIVAYVCSVISTRSAHLCAAGFSAVLMHMQKPYVTIGIDGSLYKFHRTFARILDEKINELLPSNIEVYIYNLVQTEFEKMSVTAELASYQKTLRCTVICNPEIHLPFCVVGQFL
ncbi:unnamed protein product [Toxocara canis]|uniref:Phosphotransferase n=1 Tax=Toxocara canis TaxID=6265 RepID=A0A183V2G5_TOXCA|nr:unnamed protein product [Toxocara canis]